MSLPANAIADIGSTLITILQEGLKDIIDKPTENIILFSTGEIDAGSAPRLCLFLYHIAENSHMKNREREKVNDGKLRNSGLFLDLYYMLIPYSSPNMPDKTEITRKDHEILGHAMQIFHDNAIMRDPVLKGGLAGKGLEIKLILNPVPLDEITKLWHSFQTKPFKPSVCYMVTPVVIESEREIFVTRVVEARI